MAAAVLDDSLECNYLLNNLTEEYLNNHSLDQLRKLAYNQSTENDSILKQSIYKKKKKDLVDFILSSKTKYDVTSPAANESPKPVTMSSENDLVIVEEAASPSLRVCNPPILPVGGTAFRADRDDIALLRESNFLMRSEINTMKELIGNLVELSNVAMDAGKRNSDELSLLKDSVITMKNKYEADIRVLKQELAGYVRRVGEFEEKLTGLIEQKNRLTTPDKLILADNNMADIKISDLGKNFRIKSFKSSDINEMRRWISSLQDPNFKEVFIYYGGISLLQGHSAVQIKNDLSSLVVEIRKMQADVQISVCDFLLPPLYVEEEIAQVCQDINASLGDWGDTLGVKILNASNYLQNKAGKTPFSFWQQSDFCPLLALSRVGAQEVIRCIHDASPDDALANVPWRNTQNPNDPSSDSTRILPRQRNWTTREQNNTHRLQRNVGVHAEERVEALGLNRPTLSAGNHRSDRRPSISSFSPGTGRNPWYSTSSLDRVQGGMRVPKTDRETGAERRHWHSRVPPTGNRGSSSHLSEPLATNWNYSTMTSQHGQEIPSAMYYRRDFRQESVQPR